MVKNTSGNKAAEKKLDGHLLHSQQCFLFFLSLHFNEHKHARFTTLVVAEMRHRSTRKKGSIAEFAKNLKC